MNRLKRTLVVVMTASSLLALPGTASACSCIGRAISAPEYREWFDGFNGVVFRGTVISAPERPGIVTNPSAMAQYTFKVERVWKGVTTSELVIESTADEALCGINFVCGRTYLVAATPPERPQAGVCTPGWLHTVKEMEFIAAVGPGAAR